MSDAPAPEVAAARAATVTDFADGEWHRLHRATPLFRGGITLIAIIGILIANFRERLIEAFIPGSDLSPDDPLDYLLREDILLITVAATIGGLLLIVAGFWLSWRMHTFRITDTSVEVRSGILFRTNRKARLDRIQGINIVRPFIPRLFGAAKLEISVAGNDANVPLSYLDGTLSDALRRDILALASGARRAASGPAAAASATPEGTAGADGVVSPGGSMLDARVSEFLAPELDPSLVEPESVVHMNPGRLIGSTVLGGPMIVFLILLGGLIWGVVATGEVILFAGFVPAMIGIGGFLVTRITRSLRYSIAATPDGVRVGFGLLSTTNETLPPGRIHSVKVSQPLLWRPFGWWQVAVNRASRSSASGAAGQAQTTILPVGNGDDVRTVLRLLLPDVATDSAQSLLDAGLTSRGGDDGFTVSPRRARPLRWFSVRRNGFAATDAAVLLRTGAIWRALTIVPFPRMQSVAIRQGPVLRSLALAEVSVHTVAGPISASLGALDRVDAMRLFDLAVEHAIAGAENDTSHQWGAAAVPAAANTPSAEASPEAAPPAEHP